MMCRRELPHPLAQHPTISSGRSSHRSSMERLRGCAWRRPSCGRASARATAAAMRSSNSVHSLPGTRRADVRSICRCHNAHACHRIWARDMLAGEVQQRTRASTACAAHPIRQNLTGFGNLRSARHLTERCAVSRDPQTAWGQPAGWARAPVAQRGRTRPSHTRGRP